MSRSPAIKNETAWHLTGLALLVTLVFSRSLFYDFVWDDNVLLVGQDAYESASLSDLLKTPLNGVEYLPLRDLTYLIDYQLWGWNPVGFHLTNLVLYVFCVFAVYWLTIGLTQALSISGTKKESAPGRWAALATAALFAVHPVHSEVVSFIHCRNVLLSGVFFFTSCHYFLRYLSGEDWRHLLFSLLLFLFALLSKATVIILPLILTLLLFLKSGKSSRHFAGLIPFYVLAAMFFMLFKMQALESGTVNEEAAVVFGSYDVLSKFATALQIPIFYLWKLLLPVNLSTEYGFFPNRNIVSPASLVSMSVLALLLIAVIHFRNRFPHALIALLWFLICLIPVSNFFLTNPVVADRYVYLSSFGYTFFLGALFFSARHSNLHSAIMSLLIAVIGIHAWLAFERTAVWRSELSVMEDMTKANANQPKGFVSLGLYYWDRKQYTKALENFEKAKHLSPAFSQLEFHQAKLALMRDQPDQALLWAQKALRYDGSDAHAWNLLGEIHESGGDLLAASRAYQKSLQAGNATPMTRQEASDRLTAIRQKMEPVFLAARESIANNPDDYQQRAELAVMLQTAGLLDEAISTYEDLLRLAGPNWQVYFNLGLVYRDLNQFERSLEYFQKAISINENSALVHNELGIFYKDRGDVGKAIWHFVRAAELDPGSALPQFNLGRLHFQLGNEAQAREVFRALQENFPDYRALAEDYLRRIES